ncbi:amidohydrolase [Streptomyces sp. NPDC020983]|uniref:amidohydrolase n=1 Tax=Streptomyces sp. NPDC020983 TaxID=3365106 RepID=UPI00378B9184
MAGARALQRGHLVDAYGHGVHPAELGIGAFETWLPGAAAPFTTLFDSPAGFAVRRWCPPLLGLEPHCSPARYLARRRELGAYESVRRLLRGTGIGTYLVDTGEPGDLVPPGELGAAGGAAAYEIVRLEQLAQQVADTSGTAGGFLANLAESVRGAALGAVGFACAAEGLGGGPGAASGPPPPAELRNAAARWLASRRVGSRPAEPLMLRHLAWQAVAEGLPLVLRHRQEGPGPAAAAGFLRATAGEGADLVLLPGPAHGAAAARFAEELAHVYVGVRGDPGPVLGCAPFGKVLYAGGAVGLAELYVAAARGFSAELDALAAARVAAGEWSASDAGRVAALVRAGNARRVFGLPAG